MIVGGITIIILLILSALISGSEVAFFSLSPSNINKLKESNNKHDITIVKLIEKPEKLLATILIANNFINVGIVILSSFLTNYIFDFADSPVLGFIIQVVLITFLLLTFGEILPKVYATQRALSLSKFMAYPFAILLKIFNPISTLLISATNIVNKKFANKKPNISLNDLSEALDLTSNELKEEEKILKGIVNFTNIDVKEIMVSRLYVQSINIKTEFSKLLGIIVESGFSRIPVYENSFDNIKGVLYIKDLLPYINKGNSFSWQSFIRSPYFIPETKKINDLLEDFQLRKIHMAIVIDEYGGTSGIITLEDILEEIVGEINDELDEVEKSHTQIDENNYIFEGKTQINDFYKILDIQENIFDNIKGDADTLAGLILEITGKLPKKHEVIDHKYFKFKVKSADERKIKQIYVTTKANLNKSNA
ncbi:MAG: gliding motility-associated protein GldE [Flavobacteriaceae bacterium]|nr:gliding motility-associated protein GldE [Flavobacteriaceae bacterium]